MHRSSQLQLSPAPRPASIARVVDDAVTLNRSLYLQLFDQNELHYVSSVRWNRQQTELRGVLSRVFSLDQQGETVSREMPTEERRRDGSAFPHTTTYALTCIQDAREWPEYHCHSCGELFPSRCPTTEVVVLCPSCVLGQGDASTQQCCAPWPAYTCGCCQQRYPSKRPFNGKRPKCPDCRAKRRPQPAPIAAPISSTKRSHGQLFGDPRPDEFQYQGFGDAGLCVPALHCDNCHLGGHLSRNCPRAVALFGAGLAVAPASAPPSVAGLFGAAPVAGGIFGQVGAPAPSGMFGAPAGGLFGEASAPAPAGGSLFGKTTVHTWPTPGSLGLKLRQRGATRESRGGVSVSEVTSFVVPATLKGLVIQTVAGQNVLESSYDEVIKKVKAAGRPLTMTFCDGESAASPASMFGAPAVGMFGGAAPAPVGGMFGAPAAPTGGLFGGPAFIPEFVPAGCFEGARAGMVFKNGVEGLGYYKDPQVAATLTQVGDTTTASVAALVEMGCDTEQAKEMLALTEGNLEHAIELLFGGEYRWQAGLDALMEMGFVDEDLCRVLLGEHGGDWKACVKPLMRTERALGK